MYYLLCLSWKVPDSSAVQDFLPRLHRGGWAACLSEAGLSQEEWNRSGDPQAKSTAQSQLQSRWDFFSLSPLSSCYTVYFLLSLSSRDALHVLVCSCLHAHLMTMRRRGKSVSRNWSARSKTPFVMLHVRLKNLLCLLIQVSHCPGFNIVFISNLENFEQNITSSCITWNKQKFEVWTHLAKTNTVMTVNWAATEKPYV